VRRIWKVAIAAVVLVLVATLYQYFYSQHEIFFTVRDGLSFRAYCQYQRPFVFATYFEVRGLRTIARHELPPGTDDLADCKLRFPIEDIRPDSTYSCVMISFQATDATPALFNGIERRPPLKVPLALQGLDLPSEVRERVDRAGGRGCQEPSNVAATPSN
jgi:hypothetical protein